MQFFANLVLIVQLLSAMAIIGLVLVQHGKGADMGASFGSGASGSLFGATGSANFLSRSTAVLATVFLASTLALAYFGFSVRSAPAGGGGSVLDRAPISAPASGASAAVPAPAAGADAIPLGAAAVPAPSASAAAVPPAPAASGAAQIPTK